MHMIPFSFQKVHKAHEPAGCEDAPPVAEESYSVVCDGLGGAGCKKHTVPEEEGKMVPHTSAYLGSRIVCDSVKGWYKSNYSELFELWNQNRGRQDGKDTVEKRLKSLIEYIRDAFEEKMEKWEITPLQSKTFKIFPTTLASAMYYPHPESNKITILAVWAGDSRVYMLTPGKGLQLLSVDDAPNAENEMGSTSEMNNCISAGGEFYLNYAFYDLDGPGIVFCCTDGCFDYLKSPLHLEYFLLHAISECKQDASDEKIGCVLGESICDMVYKSISDDTTMSGVIVGINSIREMQKLYKSRQDKHDSQAESMNRYLMKLGEIESERNAIRKRSAILLGENTLHEKVCTALVLAQSGRELSSEMEGILRKLKRMPSYTVYEEKKKNIEEDIRKERKGESREEDDCRAMLVRDWVASSHKKLAKGNGSGYKELEENFERYMTNLELSICICREIYKHPWFREIFEPKLSDNEIEQYIQSQDVLLRVIKEMSGDVNSQNANLFFQALYSLDQYKASRSKLDNKAEKDIDLALKESKRIPSFAQPLTQRKLKEYHERKNKRETAAITEKYTEEEQRRFDSIVEEYWQEYKNEIMKEFIHDNASFLKENIDNENQLIKFDEEIKGMQASINEIWEKYRVEYQLFRTISDFEKGVC